MKIGSAKIETNERTKRAEELGQFLQDSWNNLLYNFLIKLHNGVRMKTIAILKTHTKMLTPNTDLK